MFAFTAAFDLVRRRVSLWPGFNHSVSIRDSRAFNCSISSLADLSSALRVSFSVESTIGCGISGAPDQAAPKPQPRPPKHRPLPPPKGRPPRPTPRPVPTPLPGRVQYPLPQPVAGPWPRGPVLSNPGMVNSPWYPVSFCYIGDHNSHRTFVFGDNPICRAWQNTGR